MLNTAYTPTQVAQAERAQERAERNMHLTPELYKGLAFVCILLGVWASWITWRYFVHGSASMEADDAVREISIAAASMFIVCEMGAFALAKMLPTERLYSLRWQLLAFAVAMLAFECFTIILTQRGITKAADYHAQAVDSRTQQLEASIAAQRANAAALRDAGAHSAKSLFIASREQGAASVRQSLEVEERLAARADELAKVRAERKPTPTELLGEDGALYYAVARGLLVSLAGLVFFGAAGALLRAARTAEAGGLAGAGGVVGLPGVRFTAPGVVPQPANDGGFNLPPKTGTGYGKTWAWGAAALPLGLVAASLSPSPAQASIPTWPPLSAINTPGVGVPKSTHPDVSKPAHAARHAGEQPAHAAPEAGPQQAPAATPHSPAGVPKPTHPDVSKSAHASDTPSEAQTRKTPARRYVAAPGVKVDTGTGERDGSRFNRVRSGILAGTTRPSIRGVQAVEGGSAPVVRGYLTQLETEGLIQRHGRGWKVAQAQQVNA